jgi:hypothetical protein
VGPRAGLDAVEQIKISFPCRESNPGRPTYSPSLYRLSRLYGKNQNNKPMDLIFRMNLTVGDTNPIHNFLTFTLCKYLQT